MEYAQTLIDAAINSCGSGYKLCKLIRMDQGNLSKVRAGERGLTFAQMVNIAIVAGVDPQEAWYRVSMEQVPEAVQRDLWGKARATIGVAMLLFFVGLGLLQPSQSYAKKPEKLNLLYIVEYARRLIQGLQRCGLSLARLRLSALSLSALRLSALRLCALSHAV